MKEDNVPVQLEHMHFDFYFLSILPNNISGQWNIIRTELLKLKCLLMSNMFLCTFFLMYFDCSHFI